jgi:hypothetical protein
MHEFQLLVEPPAVVPDLACSRPLVNAALAALLELEVLDGIGEVDALAIDARISHGPIEQPAGRSHERPAQPVLLMPGLLTDESDRSADGAFARHRACRSRHNRLGCGKGCIELSHAPRFGVFHSRRSS